MTFLLECFLAIWDLPWERLDACLSPRRFPMNYFSGATWPIDQAALTRVVNQSYD
jgi:hypothetical protein